MFDVSTLKHIHRLKKNSLDSRQSNAYTHTTTIITMCVSLVSRVSDVHNAFGLVMKTNTENFILVYVNFECQLKKSAWFRLVIFYPHIILSRCFFFGFYFYEFHHSFSLILNDLCFLLLLFFYF